MPGSRDPRAPSSTRSVNDQAASSTAVVFLPTFTVQVFQCTRLARRCVAGAQTRGQAKSWMLDSSLRGCADHPESTRTSAGNEQRTLGSPGSNWSMIQGWADRSPEAAALVSSGRAPLGYAALLDQMRETGEALRCAGVGRADTVALVLPDGSETATAFLGIASAALCAPLNPGYREAELEYYLSDLSARALVLPRGSEGPARE